MSTPNPAPAGRTTRVQKNDSIHLAELWQILKFRRILLYLFVSLTVTGAIFRQIFYIPTYSATTLLNVQKAENSPMQMALANISQMGGYDSSNTERIQKYLTYLNSSEFHLSVAQNLKFQEGYQLLNLTQPSEMALTKKKFWQHFLSTGFGAKPRGAGEEKLGQPEVEPVLVPVEKLAGIIQGVTVAEDGGSDTIRLRVTTLDSFTSMVLANSVAEEFIKKIKERDYNEVAEVKRFIAQQLENTTERLKRSELALVEFKKRHNIISINAEQDSYSSRLTSIESELASAKLKFDENQKLVDYYQQAMNRSEKRLLDQGSASVRTSSTDVANQLRGQLDSLRYKKVLMQAQGYTEDAWQMGEINKEIDRVAEQLKKSLSTPGTGDDEATVPLEMARGKIAQLKVENRALEAKIMTIEKTRNELLRSLSSLPNDEQVLLTLKRDVDLQFELFSSLKKKLQEVEIQQVALQSHVLIGSRADLPPPAPRTHFIVKILFALLVGGFLGGSLAFMLEAIDPTVKHRSDLEALELITLGSIPHVEGSAVRQSLGGVGGSVQAYRPDLLICKEKPESPESMAFKHIRAQVATLRGSDGKPAKVITVTSPGRGDGKTFVAANLAIALSQLEKQTIFVDCDFRNPSAPYLFGYRENDGLTSVLTWKASLDEVMIKDMLPNLDVLPAGWVPPNPTELISNDKFWVLLEHLRAHYDYVILDSPPAGSIVDASVMGSHSDAIVMATSFRRTRKNAVLLALQKILTISHKHVYAVLNDVMDSPEHSAYGQVARGQTLPNPTEVVDVRADLLRFEESLNRRKAG